MRAASGVSAGVRIRSPSRFRQPAAARPHLRPQRLHLASADPPGPHRCQGARLAGAPLPGDHSGEPAPGRDLEGDQKPVLGADPLAAGAAARVAVRPGDGAGDLPLTACFRNRGSWIAGVRTGQTGASTWRRCCTAWAIGSTAVRELLFRLRQVDPAELVTAEMALPRGRRTQTSWPTINSAAFSASSSMRIRTPAPPRPDPVRVQPAGGAYSLPSTVFTRAGFV